jgi:tRNA-specific 2-thiouridylase
MCNKEVKFGAFFSWAKQQDKDAYIATGHYSRLQTTDNRQQTTEVSVLNNHLMKSKDENKDQTYFLWTLTSEILQSVLFPIGDMEKKDVRAYAVQNALPVSAKKDSQGLCFVGTIDVKTLLKNYISEKEGDILNEKGEVIGHHNGVMFYTIGERHGFTITKKTTDDAPYFVVGKDIEKNTITVSHTSPQEEKNTIVTLEKTNWTKDIKQGDTYEARARYRAPLATIEVIDETHIKVLHGDITKASGQSLVLYDGDLCIGGGVIL